MSGNIDETNATAKRGVGFLPTEPDAIVGDLLLKKNQQMKQQQSDDETVMECCQLMLVMAGRAEDDRDRPARLNP